VTTIVSSPVSHAAKKVPTGTCSLAPLPYQMTTEFTKACRLDPSFFHSQ
jgi:hypothetical protein